MTRERPQRSSPLALIVDDEAPVHRMVRRALRPFPWEVCALFAPADALPLLDEDRALVLALVDLSFPGESETAGLDLIEAIRTRRPHTTCCALSALSEGALINRVADLGATFLAKWETISTVRRLAGRITIERAVPDRDLARVIDDFRQEHGLSPRESEIVALAAADLARAEIPARLDMSEGTLKEHIAGILERTQLGRLDAISRLLRRRARGDAPAPADAGRGVS